MSGLKTILTMAAGLGLLAVTAAAQAPSYGTKLADCRAAAQSAGADATAFKCDWRAVVKGAPGAALTGKFIGQIAGTTATLTILEGGDGPALVAVTAVHRASGHTCTLKGTARRGNDDALAATTAMAPGCGIRIASSGLNRIRVVSKGCQALCGARAGFDGTYRLAR